ncbi:MAG: ribonuclease domain-containing protein [Niabella sp.]
MKLKNKNVYLLLLLIAAIFVVYRYYRPVVADKVAKADASSNNNLRDIKQLTRESVVVPYIRAHHQLPGYYITKSSARAQGWDPAAGNLCEVLPGKAIGGDVFSNREGSLPGSTGRKWFEADLNYDCAHRNADRLLYSSDGLIYVTYDHYKSFRQK